MEKIGISPEHLESCQERLDALRLAIAPLEKQPAFTLEIGSGHGHFLTAYAAANPGHHCVGIDLILDRFNRSERKRNRARLSNLQFIRAEALEFLYVLPRSTQISQTFILFPDPWPKRRHHKNRLIQPSFLSQLAEHTDAAAKLFFRTDHEEYFHSAKGVIGRHSDWQIEPGAAWPFEEETVFQRRAAAFNSLVASRIS